MEHYDVVIIGTGQAGGPLSTAMAESGRTVAIIERESAGGTCINFGCMPTKTMVASARVAHLAKRGREFGVHTGGVSIDQSVIRDRKRSIVEQMRSGVQRSIEKPDQVDLIFGEATFTGPKSIRVSGQDAKVRDLEAAEWIFINSGARPSIPTIAGIDTVPFLTSTTVMELDQTPEHLMVLGGGYIGLEFGQMFRRFGSEVTIIHRGSRLIEREDDDIAEAMRSMLESEGITVLLNASATATRSTENGIELDVRVKGEERTLQGSHLLLAVGRQLNSDRLNLSAAGIETGKRGEIVVNTRLETSAEGVFALGDVTGGPAFTHISYDDFRIVRDNLLHAGNRRTDDRPVPYVIFTDPELGRVGLSERDATKQGIDYRLYTMGMESVARAIVSAETTGLMKALVDPATDQILGAAVFGVHGGEIMTIFQMAMMGGVTRAQIADMIVAHPTLAESVNNLLTS